MRRTALVTAVEGVVADRTFGEPGGVAGGEQQGVVLAEWQVQAAGEVDDHLAAGHGPSGLDVAEVFGRHAGTEAELELAHAAVVAPGAQLTAEGRHVVGQRHGPDRTDAAAGRPSPAR